MIGAPAILTDLLADCDARGIRLFPSEGGGLLIDAPHDTLTPQLLERLKAHKADLLATLRAATKSTIPAVSIHNLGLAQRRPTPPPAPPRPMARCERCHSAKYIDVPIHKGQSIRRDCARCGRLLDFPLWHGQADGVPV
jgi:hypothetical protein